MIEISKQDRKIFRNKIGGWQLRYMDKLNQEYINLLTNPDMKADEKFWALEKRIRQAKKHPGVVCDISRDIELTVLRLIQDKVITFDDLDGFTDEFKDIINTYISIVGKYE